MTECDVREECIVLRTLKRAHVLFPQYVSNPAYQCGFENVATVDACPKRKRLRAEDVGT